MQKEILQNEFIHFDGMEILRENEIGLWIMRINKEDKTYELHVDEIMEKILGIDRKYTPQECYDFWFSRIEEKQVSYVAEKVEVMTESFRSVQISYLWNHPLLGKVRVRSSGKCVNVEEGRILLKGYHRILDTVDGA